MTSTAARVALAAAALATCVGCVRLPQAPPERALYLDLRAIVETRARIDWVVDEHEVREASPAIMTSACQATPEARLALAGWLDGRLTEEGGPSRVQWAEAGEDIDAVEEALLIERISAALAYAEANRVDCPYWLRPDAGFTGVQTNTDRFVLLAESMGSGQLVIQEGEVAIGGTGLGRLIPAWGVSDRLTLGIGAEVGVASTFPRTESGGRSVKAVATAGVPLLLRVHDGTLRYDLDLAAVTRATRNEYEGLRYGGRVGLGLGVATLRIAGVMPYAMIWAGYEYLAPGAGEPETHIMRAGSRVGINWDP